MRKIFIIVFVLGLQNSFSTYAQKFESLENFTVKSNDYFSEDRENVFLHLNKTSLLPGETLWFSAYTLETVSKLPSKNAVNLEVSIFEENGQLVESKTILLENGAGSGFFEFNKEIYLDGNFLITASTTYQKNFKENLAFKQIFEILGTAKEKNENLVLDLDLQMLPEGGHLLDGAENVVGVKLLNSKGRGVPFKNALVKNRAGIILEKFDSNIFGHGKFKLLVDANEDYTLTVSTENKNTIIKNIPKPELTGVLLAVKNNETGGSSINLRTNKRSSQSLIGKTYTVVLHQNDQLGTQLVEFTENKLEFILNLKKEDLFSGVNTVTVFNEDFLPVAERLFYNLKTDERLNLKARFFDNLGDSIKIAVKSTVPNTESIVSISVLPQNNISNIPWNSTISSFKLKPFIKGDLENGYYYFAEDVDFEKRAKDLDLLLLTQGWSAYDWQNIYNGKPEIFYPPQRGYEIRGRIVNKVNKNERKLLISAENSFNEVVEISPDNSFELENNILFEDTRLTYQSFNDKTQQFSRPNIVTTILPAKKTDIKIDVSKIFSKSPSIKSTEKDAIIIPDNFIQGTTLLESVNLKSSISKEKIDRKFSAAYASETIITPEISNSVNYIVNYIRLKGFDVAGDALGITIFSRRAGSINSQFKYSPVVFFDGAQLSSTQEQGTILGNLRTEDVESIYINKSGAGYGSLGAGGVIKIKTKTSYSSSNITSNRLVYRISHGFAKNKQFYAPNYVDYSNSIFASFGTIHWIPKLELRNTTEKTFKVLNTLTPNLMLYIEGFDVDGKLISEIITVPVK